MYKFKMHMKEEGAWGKIELRDRSEVN